jgi:hypothetical protein
MFYSRGRTDLLNQIDLDGQLNFGEVLFYFQASVGGTTQTLALVSIYSPPDLNLLRLSSQTLWACRHQGTVSLRVIDFKTIISVVAMVPLPHIPDLFFVVEKMGLDVADLAGSDERVEEN